MGSSKTRGQQVVEEGSILQNGSLDKMLEGNISGTVLAVARLLKRKWWMQKDKNKTE